MNNDASWTAQERGPYRLLIVEDEPLMRSIIVQLARSEGYEVSEAPAAEIALQIFEKEKIDLAILDLNLTSGGSGLDVLRKMRELDPEVMGIIVTAYASVESAVEALHQGAYDYITKPFERSSEKGDAQCARGQGAVQGEPVSAAGTAREVSLREYHRQKRRNRKHLPRYGKSRAHRFERVDHRRVGHRQGTGRARDSFQFRSRQQPLPAD